MTIEPLSDVSRAAPRAELTLMDVGAVLLPRAPSSLVALVPEYRRALIPKRSGAPRELWIPSNDLGFIQRRINRFLLSNIRPHLAAHAYTADRSIATNARCHAGAALIIKLDLEDFFPSVSPEMVHAFWSKWTFPIQISDGRRLGPFSAEAAAMLTKLTCWRGGLPQGAPTSPAVSNFCAYLLDVRLTALAESVGATYTRYSDDITLSFRATPDWQHYFLKRAAGDVIADCGFKLNAQKSKRFFTSKERLEVTGLVVNESPNLKREQRRRLRAARHRRNRGLPPREGDYSAAQLAGWESLMTMVRKQAGVPARDELEDGQSEQGSTPPAG